MVDDVNLTKYHDLIKYQWDTLMGSSADYWDEFCTQFNICYSRWDKTPDKENLHYFRNKLNRAPATFDLLLEEASEWEMLKIGDSVYHMFGDDGIYNTKFVSKDGKYEAVYNRDGNLLTYLEPGESYHDKNGNVVSVVNDPINMGTYNYGDPNASGLAVLKHVYYDVKPYTTEWFPVVGLGLGWFNIPDGPTIDCAAKNYNGTNHEASATAPGERTTRENLFSSEGGTVL